MYNRKLCDLYNIGWLDDKNAYTIINFSQYFSKSYHAKKWHPFTCFKDKPQVMSNIILLANSLEEIEILKEFCSTCTVFFFPNNAFLDHNMFTLRDKNEPNIINTTHPVCIVNAKGHIWKRHDLSVPIPNRIFITYDRKPHAQLERYHPNKIYENLSPNQVANILHTVDFGAVFTSKEGNCYASNEYLLSGLPVLSVKSTGGRDVFYEEGRNAITCNATIKGVAEGYERMKTLLLNNLDRNKIRENVIHQVEYFRKTLTEFIFDILLRSGSAHDSFVEMSVVREALFSEHKADNYINFYVSKISENDRNIKPALTFS